MRTAVEGVGGGLGLLLGAAPRPGGRAAALDVPVGSLMPGAFERILVPMKIGPIGEEVLGTAIKLAEEHACAITALHVMRVPLDKPLEAELVDAEEEAEASLAEAKLLGVERGVEVEGIVVRARAIGEAIVDEARGRDADLVVMGSAPRWRRQSRFFSPTVDYVLRKAPCEVMVIAYPQGVLDEDGAGG